MTEQTYTVFGQETVFQHWWTKRGMTEIARFERAEVHHIRKKVREFGRRHGFPARLYDAETAGSSRVINPDEGSI